MKNQERLSSRFNKKKLLVSFFFRLSDVMLSYLLLVVAAAVVGITHATNPYYQGLGVFADGWVGFYLDNIFPETGATTYVCADLCASLDASMGYSTSCTPIDNSSLLYPASRMNADCDVLIGSTVNAIACIGPVPCNQTQQITNPNDIDMTYALALCCCNTISCPLQANDCDYDVIIDSNLQSESMIYFHEESCVTTNAWTSGYAGGYTYCNDNVVGSIFGGGFIFNWSTPAKSTNYEVYLTWFVDINPSIQYLPLILIARDADDNIIDSIPLKSINQTQSPYSDLYGFERIGEFSSNDFPNETTSLVVMTVPLISTGSNVFIIFDAARIISMTITIHEYC